MIPEAGKDVLGVIRDAIDAIKNKRYADLHTISDHILHTIVIYQDSDVINLSIVIYALNKILETEKYRTHPKMKAFEKAILKLLQTTQKQVEAGNYAGCAQTIEKMLDCIQSFTKEIRFYIEDILHFARIKKATKLYEHGLSLGRAAELMNVTKWELMPAIGETTIHEQFPTPPELNAERLKALGKMFKARRKKRK